MFQDLRHAARMFLKNPGFALIAVLSIALGTGANVAMFSAVDANLLRPLPVPRPSELLTAGSAFTLDNLNYSALFASYPDYVDIQKGSRGFAGIAAYRNVAAGFTSAAGGLAQAKGAAAVSGSFFEVLGVPPALGRGFRPGEDGVVILSYGFWREQFSLDPGVIGRRVRIGDDDLSVIGVAPERFTGLSLERRPSFYLPLKTWSRMVGRPDILDARDWRGLTLKARLKTGTGRKQAAAELAAISADLLRSYPDANRGQRFTLRTETEERAGEDPLRVYGIAIMTMLAVAVLCVACFNVAGLLSSRAPTRAKEIALRLAVGAGRARLIRQLLAESSLIAGAGGLLGLPTGYVGIALLRRIQFANDLVQAPVPEMDGRALMFTLGIAIASAFLFGLIPAIQTTRVELTNAIKAGESALARRRFTGRNVLVAGQVAISLVLLTVAAFVYGIFHDELRHGPGFRTDRALLMSFDPGLAGYSDAQSQRFYEKLFDTARTVPGVLSASLAQTIPLDNQALTGVVPEGHPLPPGQENIMVWVNRVDERYFDTLGIAMLRGRAFLETDTASSPRVAVVNQTFASHYWPGQNPIGKRFRLTNAKGSAIQIVGVAQNGKYLYPGEPPVDFIYLPRSQDPPRGLTLVASSIGPSASLAAPLREAARAVDPRVPVYDVRTIEDFYQAKVIDISDVATNIVGAMGVMGLLLAMVGLYGLMSHAVNRRVREIGIRMAVGADRDSVLRMILRQAMTLAGVGVALGLVLSAGAARLLRLYPLNHVIEPRLYFSITPILLAIALLAAYLPARRASRVDPMAALRYE
ncbi:MAG TPA: ABC transporter permease [Bryobacteraceae bacterium]|jgi:predicted permease